jgi:hypothetical protein
MVFCAILLMVEAALTAQALARESTGLVLSAVIHWLMVLSLVSFLILLIIITALSLLVLVVALRLELEILLVIVILLAVAARILCCFLV